MTERWRGELTKLRQAQPPTDLWGRIAEGPSLAPLEPRRPSRAAATVTAFAVFALAAVLVWKVFAPFGTTSRPGAGSDVLDVPPVGEVAPVFLEDGRPVFVVHHDDGTISVLNGYSSHGAWGFGDLNVWCPPTREFVEVAHETHFDEFGVYVAGPAPGGVIPFAFEVVERDAAGDPTRIRVGEMQPADPGRVPMDLTPEEAASRPPFCPDQDGEPADVVTHAIDGGGTFATPAEVLAAEPEGWVPVRGQLLVAHDGFTQLCGDVVRGPGGEEACVDGAILRGIDGIRLRLEVLEVSPGNGYELGRLWLVRVQDGVLSQPAGIGHFELR